VLGKVLRARRSISIRYGVHRHLETFTILSLEDQLSHLGKNVSYLGGLQRLPQPWLHQPFLMKDDMLREWVAINLDIHLAVPRQQAVGRPLSG
jgi:hypothetical protein